MIDRWFLHKLKVLSDFEKKMRDIAKIEDEKTSRELLVHAKCLGFSDKQIARYLNSTEIVIRRMRKELNIKPVVKQIDTVAAEFPAQNNYLYMTYNGKKFFFQSQ